MNKRALTFAALLSTSVVAALLLLPSRPRKESLPPHAQKEKTLPAIVNTKASGRGKQVALSLLNHLPMSFEENRGQTDAQVKYLARGKDYGLFLATTEATIVHHATVRLWIWRKAGIRWRQSPP